MQGTASKEIVLKKISDALINRGKAPFTIKDSESDIDFFKYKDELQEVSFAMAFKNLGGNFVYCADEKEFCQNLIALKNSNKFEYIYCNDDNLIEFLKICNISYYTTEEKLRKSDCSLTVCEYLISRTGTILISAYNKENQRTYFTSPVHFVLAYTSQLVTDLSDAFKGLKLKYDKLPHFITLISGPSRTADIEKTLVMGAHGPKELFVFLIDDIV